MAKLTGNLSFTGSLANLSAYTRRDLDKVILRTKGGASKEKIKRDPAFAATRRHNQEWKGVTSACKAFRSGIYAVKHLADYNITGAINALCKRIQLADTVGIPGQRSVIITAHTYMLEGFDLNKRNLFDSIIRHPVSCSIDRNTLSAAINIPLLVPGISFINPGSQKFYRIVLMLGAVSDCAFDETKMRYMALDANAQNIQAFAETEWLPVMAERAAETITLQAATGTITGEHSSLIVSAGIEFGAPDAIGVLQYVPYSGSAKVLKLG